MNVCITTDPSTVNTPVSFAAAELARYLNLMGIAAEVSAPKHALALWDQNEPPGFGGDIITIRLESAGEPITGSDGYSIHITPEGGVIRGRGDRSVLLGVYGYLYHLGCRFLAPGKKHERIPRLDRREQLAVRCEKTAALRYRGVCMEGANSLENILDFVDWLPKLGYNSFFLQFMLPYAFMARWYHHENNPLPSREAFTWETAKAYTDRIEEEITRRGLLLHQAGHGWTCQVLGLPGGDWKASSRQPAQEAIPMAAMLNGERGLFHGIPMNTNLCYSNQTAIEAFSRCVADYADEHPAASYIHVWLADAFNNICECGTCKKEAPTDQYIRLLNRIDGELTRRGLNTKIVFLLYQELLWPPVKEVLKNQERFVLMFAPISRTFLKSYAIKNESPPIPPYVRNHMALPADLDENLAFLKAWQKRFKGDGFVYDYPLGRAHYGDFGYIHITGIISGDIGKLRQMGLNGYISCQELRVSFPNALPNYVMGHMLFDGDRTLGELTDEYFRAAYGKGWQQVLAYLKKLSSLCNCDYFNGKGKRTDPELAASMERLIKLAKTTPVNPSQDGGKEGGRIFWKYLDYHREYCIGLGRALQMLSSGKEKEASECFEKFHRLICKNEAKFQECLDVYRVTDVSCNYAGLRLPVKPEETP